MTAVASSSPTTKPWPPVPGTLTAAQLLARLSAPPVDERTAKRVRVFVLRNARGHAMEAFAETDAKAADIRNAGGRYSHTLVIGEPRKQQGGGW